MVWLPQTDTVEILDVRADAPLQPAESLGQLRWWHHGSSISHCIEAATPRGVWPVAAAEQLGLDVTNLGFAANAHLDPFTARAMRDSGADLFSLKIGINIVGADTMKRRTFIPAVHGFLDTIRDGAPSVPILVISPIFCPALEDTPGPAVTDPVTGERRGTPPPHRTSSSRLSHCARFARSCKRSSGHAPRRTPPLLSRRAGSVRCGRHRGAARRASPERCRVPADRGAVRPFPSGYRMDCPRGRGRARRHPRRSRRGRRARMTTFTNPVLAGDRPDPAVIKVGDEYWLTYSSFEAAPGLPLYRSTDLVNWTYETSALPNPRRQHVRRRHRRARRPLLHLHPVHPDAVVDADRRVDLRDPRRCDERSVVGADRPRHPRRIDPGHVVGEDGTRYLFTSGVRRIQLADDGLRRWANSRRCTTAGGTPTTGSPRRTRWRARSFSGSGRWFYLVSAVGGTGGPPTGHMVIVARSRSVHGPWENHPRNPIARTRGCGRGVVVARARDAGPGPAGTPRRRLVDGLARIRERVPHPRPADPARADPRGARTTGPRPPSATSADRSQRARRCRRRRPRRRTSPTTSRSSNSAGDGPSTLPAAGEAERVRVDDGLVLRGKGTSPADTSPLAHAHRRPRVRDRGRRRRRARCRGRPAAVLQQPALLRHGHRRRADAELFGRHPHALARARARHATASRCASATTSTSSPAGTACPAGEWTRHAHPLRDLGLPRQHRRATC